MGIREDVREDIAGYMSRSITKNIDNQPIIQVLPTSI
jgi:hypothetical protein